MFFGTGAIQKVRNTKREGKNEKKERERERKREGENEKKESQRSCQFLWLPYKIKNFNFTVT